MISVRDLFARVRMLRPSDIVDEQVIYCLTESVRQTCRKSGAIKKVAYPVRIYNGMQKCKLKVDNCEVIGIHEVLYANVPEKLAIGVYDAELGRYELINDSNSTPKMPDENSPLVMDRNSTYGSFLTCIKPGSIYNITTENKKPHNLGDVLVGVNSVNKWAHHYKMFTKKIPIIGDATLKGKDYSYGRHPIYCSFGLESFSVYPIIQVTENVAEEPEPANFFISITENNDYSSLVSFAHPSHAQSSYIDPVLSGMFIITCDVVPKIDLDLDLDLPSSAEDVIIDGACELLYMLPGTSQDIQLAAEFNRRHRLGISRLAYLTSVSESGATQQLPPDFLGRQ